MPRNLLRAGALLCALMVGPLTQQKQAFTSFSAFPPDFWPVTIYTANPYVEKIECDEGSGTGFKLQDGRWVSAFHVAGKLHGCSIDGRPIHLTEGDEGSDYAIFDVPGDRRFGGLPVDCQGYRDQQWYFGVGHGRGDPWPQIVSVRYSAFYTFLAHNGWAILDVNRFVPGMSGGPVFDQWGRVAGIVNAFGVYTKLSMSLPLQETPICQK